MNDLHRGHVHVSDQVSAPNHSTYFYNSILETFTKHRGAISIPDILTYNSHFTYSHKWTLSCTEFYEQATNKLNLYCPA